VVDHPPPGGGGNFTIILLPPPRDFTDFSHQSPEISLAIYLRPPGNSQLFLKKSEMLPGGVGQPPI